MVLGWLALCHSGAVQRGLYKDARVRVPSVLCGRSRMHACLPHLHFLLCVCQLAIGPLWGCSDVCSKAVRLGV